MFYSHYALLLRPFDLEDTTESSVEG